MLEATLGRGCFSSKLVYENEVAHRRVRKARAAFLVGLWQRLAAGGRPSSWGPADPAEAEGLDVAAWRRHFVAGHDRLFRRSFDQRWPSPALAGAGVWNQPTIVSLSFL